MDKVDKSTRSKIMGRVRSKETKLETTFRKLLWQYGIRYTKNNKQFFGKPDLAFKNKKTVVFIDSCYWHGCKDHLRMPSSNTDYWTNKIKRNRDRDEEVNKHYTSTGWRTIRIWEHDLKTDILKEKKIKELLKVLRD